jgi:hypothetical protein
MEDIKKCSFENHSEIDAVSYCVECDVFMCNKCMYCTPIVRDHVNGKMRPDIHGDTSKFLSNFGSTNKFIGLTRMAIDRSMGDRYIWDL